MGPGLKPCIYCPSLKLGWGGQHPGIFPTQVPPSESLGQGRGRGVKSSLGVLLLNKQLKIQLPQRQLQVAEPRFPLQGDPFSLLTRTYLPGGEMGTWSARGPPTAGWAMPCGEGVHFIFTVVVGGGRWKVERGRGGARQQAIGRHPSF